MADIDGRDLDDSVRLVNETVLNFFLGGLFLAVAFCTNSRVIAFLGWGVSAFFIIVGWGRPVRQRPAHRIKLWLGGIMCMWAGAAVRLIFEARGSVRRVGIVLTAVIALLVGFFTILSRQGQVWKEL